MKNIICVQGTKVLVATYNDVVFDNSVTDDFRFSPIIIAHMTGLCVDGKQKGERYVFAFSGSSGAAISGITAIVNGRQPPKTDKHDAYVLLFRSTQNLRHPWVSYDSYKRHFEFHENNNSCLIGVSPNSIVSGDAMHVMRVAVESRDDEAANNYIVEAANDANATAYNDRLSIVEYDAAVDSCTNCCALSELPCFMRVAN